MNKLFILFLSLLVLINVGYSTTLYEGNIDNCEHIIIKVNSTYPIDMNEFNLSNCIMKNMSYWNCNCNDINFTYKINAINNYSFMIEIYDERYKSSGSHKIYYYNEDNESKDEIVRFQFNYTLNETELVDLINLTELTNNNTEIINETFNETKSDDFIIDDFIIDDENIVNWKNVLIVIKIFFIILILIGAIIVFGGTTKID